MLGETKQSWRESWGKTSDATPSQNAALPALPASGDSKTTQGNPIASNAEPGAIAGMTQSEAISESISEPWLYISARLDLVSIPTTPTVKKPPVILIGTTPFYCVTPMIIQRFKNSVYARLNKSPECEGESIESISLLDNLTEWCDRKFALVDWVQESVNSRSSQIWSAWSKYADDIAIVSKMMT
mgnify:CR=1 FL=1